MASAQALGMEATPGVSRISVVLALACSAATLASAHPGHDHGHIPSLIRHPFAGPEHLLGSVVCGLALGGVVFLATRRVAMPALVRWSGLGLVAAVATLSVGFAS